MRNLHDAPLFARLSRNDLAPFFCSTSTGKGCKRVLMKCCGSILIFIGRQAVNDGEKRFRDTAFSSYAIISI